MLRRGPRPLSKTTDANLDCVLVKKQVQLRWTKPSRVNKLAKQFFKYFQTSNLNTLELSKEKTKTQADNSSFQYFFLNCIL